MNNIQNPNVASAQADQPRHNFLCSPKQPLHLAFIDLTKALNLVDSDSLFTVLSKSGCPLTILPLVKFLHFGMTSKVRCDRDISDSFPANRGAKQGCVMATTLLGTYFAYVARIASAKIFDSAGVSLLWELTSQIQSRNQSSGEHSTRVFVC